MASTIGTGLPAMRRRAGAWEEAISQFGSGVHPHAVLDQVTPTSGCIEDNIENAGPPTPRSSAPPPPCVTFRPVAVSLRGPGQSPGLPFACCVGSLRSVGRCGRCSCWCRFRVRGAQSLVCRGCAECGGVCRLRVSGAQYLAYRGCAGCCGGRLTVFAAHAPQPSGRPQPASLRFRVREAQVPHSSTRCTGRPAPALHQSVGRTPPLPLPRQAHSVIRESVAVCNRGLIEVWCCLTPKGRHMYVLRYRARHTSPSAVSQPSLVARHSAPNGVGHKKAGPERRTFAGHGGYTPGVRVGSGSVAATERLRGICRSLRNPCRTSSVPSRCPRSMSRASGPGVRTGRG